MGCHAGRPSPCAPRRRSPGDGASGLRADRRKAPHTTRRCDAVYAAAPLDRDLRRWRAESRARPPRSAACRSPPRRSRGLASIRSRARDAHAGGIEHRPLHRDFWLAYRDVDLIDEREARENPRSDLLRDRLDELARLALHDLSYQFIDGTVGDGVDKLVTLPRAAQIDRQ